MLHKFEVSYINIFENLKIICIENNININFENITFMSDFEYGLRKALKISFPNSSILGCYYHYVKNIFKKFKELGLCKKKIF